MSDLTKLKWTMVGAVVLLLGIAFPKASTAVIAAIWLGAMSLLRSCH